MRIPCPHCGPRDLQEFVCRGEAPAARPTSGRADADAAVFEYVYLRDNVAGLSREHWYHAAGCRSWLLIVRDTRSHQIVEASFAGGAG